MAHGASAPPRPGIQRWLWIFSVAAAVICLLASYAGFWRISDEETPWKILEPFYSSGEMLLLHVPHESLAQAGAHSRALLALHVARIFAVLSAATLAVALILRFLGNWMLRCWRGVRGRHTIICGFGPIARQLLLEFKKDRPVVIDHRVEHTEVQEVEAWAALLEGNPASAGALSAANAAKASHLFAVTDDDGANVGIAVQAIQLAGSKPPQPHVLVHITDPQLRASLRQHAVFASECGGPRVTMFNVFENSARLLFLRPNHQLDYVRIGEDDPRAVQLVVIGFGLMGEALVTRAAMVGHFANLKQPRIVVIDKSAMRKQRIFRARYPHFDRVVDAHFLELDAEEPVTQERIGELCADAEKTISTVAITFDNDTRGLSLAWSLLDRVRPDVPIRLRLSEHLGLRDLKLPERITVFGSMHDACSREHWLNDELNRMARALHEYHRRSVHESGRATPDDRSLRDWDSLADDLIDSNRQAADHIWVKLRAAGCHAIRKGQPDPGPIVKEFRPEEVERLAKMEHQRWMAERYLAGWEWAEKKNTPNRKSPYLVPWEQLDDETAQWDRDFAEILPGLLDNAGWEIHR